jgi:AcrR family transcriptional regulator
MTDQTVRRNASVTRNAILEAARLAFTRHGFDQVGVREITHAAGVNPSLVNRYFGTKEQMFAEVMQVGLGFDGFGDGSQAQIIRWLTDYVLDKTVDREVFDPMLSLIRSAAVAQAQPVLRDYLAREAIEPLAKIIGGEAASERASFIVAFLIGVIVMRSVIKSDPLIATGRNDIAEMFEQILAVVGSPSMTVA